jgi:hypothetical protein
MAMGKYLCLCLVVILATSSLFMINPTIAQNPSPTPYPVPSTPNFTVTITNSSYFVPVTYSIDPSTGEEIVNKTYYSGYVDALNVTLAINNQPLALSTNPDINNGFTYYIEAKPHISANWTKLTPDEGILPSRGQDTTLTYQFSNPYFPIGNEKNYTHYSSGLTYSPNPFVDITVNRGELIDFRVKAGIGTRFWLSMGQGIVFNGNYSDWNQLTITMASGETATANLSPTPSPTIPELSWLVVVPLLLSLFAVAVIVRHRKTANMSK